MKATTRNMAEAIAQVLGPIFRANPDYKTIKEAIALTVARVAQSTPDVGNEEEELEQIMRIAADALNIFINEEDSFKTRQALLAQGVDDFAKLIEPGSSADYPDNCDQPVAKTVKPFNPHHTLEAFNGGLGATAQAEAERFAGQDHDEPNHKEAQGKFSGRIAEGGNPGEFGYKIVDGEESPAGRTYEEINQVIRAAGGTPEAYDQSKADNA